MYYLCCKAAKTSCTRHSLTLRFVSALVCIIFAAKRRKQAAFGIARPSGMQLRESCRRSSFLKKGAARPGQEIGGTLPHRVYKEASNPLMGLNKYHMARQQLDQLDYKILSMLSENPRVPFLEVARECGVSGAAIHQRVQRLMSVGIIRESDYLIDPNKIGFETCAYMGLYLQRPDQFEDVIAKLKKIPEVVECHYTTGQYDMFIKLYAKNNAHLLDIIHDKLQPLGLARTESIISFKEAFRQPLPVDDLS